jgi:prolyl-tRNA editing enzyme YbaK/EbsC (Cys-tRNA(Pro) deacylase)
MLTPNDIQTYLEEQSIPGEILVLEMPTPTVEDAALAVGTTPQQIVKSILFIVGDQPVLAVSCGTDRVDRRVIAAIYGVGRKKVKLASPEVMLEVSGYEAGAMPPFAHRQKIKTLLDQRVLQQPVVYAGGGAENALMRLSPEDILKATNAQVMDLVNAPSVES